MKPEIYSTHALRTRDQFEAWREWHQPVLDFLPEESTDYGFPAEVHFWKLGGLGISRSIVPPIRVARTRSTLKLDPIDHWVVTYCVRGTHFVNTAGTTAEIPAKMPFLSSLGREFLHERTHIDRIQLLMAREAFQDVAPLLDAAGGLVLDTPLGHLLGDSMLALERHLPGLTEDDVPRLTNAVGAMIAAAIAPTIDHMAAAGRQLDLGRKERVRQVVRRHLQTPGLGPESLSRLAGMSRSVLYRLLEDAGGVARYIQHQRLLEARALLSDPRTTRSIAAIAENLCFADAAGFSRAFKREFGCRPSEARSGAPAGGAPGGTKRDLEPSERRDLAALLRAF